MTSKMELEKRLEFRRTALEQARNAYLALLSGGVKSYAIGSRNLTKFDLPQLEHSCPAAHAVKPWESSRGIGDFHICC